MSQGGSLAERRILQGVLTRVAATPRALVLFDLDGTLIDNRPRTQAIYRSIALRWRARGQPEASLLEQADVRRLPFSIEASLRELGLADPVLREEALALWRREFFCNRWLHCDARVDGAREFAVACRRSGARLIYLTARDAPAMRAGTLRSLEHLGFPLDPSVALRMKRHRAVADAEHKRVELRQLRRLGPVVAFFDNEPGHCNDALELCPEAEIVLVDTGHHAAAPALRGGVQAVADFGGFLEGSSEQPSADPREGHHP